MSTSNIVEVYTDGACENNGYYMNGGAAGIGVWFGDGHELYVCIKIEWFLFQRFSQN